MKILALDSSALTAAAAICEDGHLLAQTTVNAARTHSETLLPMINSLLSSLSLKIDDIGLLACSAGP
ncbi:MAG: tRNA (adenosine(37)-N6)-threonylcarbamoyltransferase complex dimerization subunit type 1 TsaB, partial [Eubacteriales bacterium]